MILKDTVGLAAALQEGGVCEWREVRGKRINKEQRKRQLGPCMCLKLCGQNIHCARQKAKESEIVYMRMHTDEQSSRVCIRAAEALSSVSICMDARNYLIYFHLLYK